MTNPLSELQPEELFVWPQENITVPPGQEHTLFATGTGPGVVQSLWMAVGGGNTPVLDGRIRVYYGSTLAMDMDLGTLLVTHWGASGVHKTPHLSADIVGTGNGEFLFTFPMPFHNDGIRVAYYNVPGNQTAVIYSMVGYRYLATFDGMRLWCQGKRFQGQAVNRTAGDVTTLMSTISGPGSIVYHSQVGGVGAANLTWLERNFTVTLDGNPDTVKATGTEDWFDSAWYFQGRRDFSPSLHTYIGTDQPSFMPNAVGMATDLLSKWGGIPFQNSAVMKAETEPACTTGDTVCWSVLYYA